MDWLSNLLGFKAVEEARVAHRSHGSAADAIGMGVDGLPMGSHVDDDVHNPQINVGGLDLTEIYPRIWVSGLPYNAVTSVASSRNNVNDLAQFLDYRFGGGRYVLFNLACEDKCSYDVMKFNGQVAKFPPVLDDSEYTRFDDGLPTVGEAFRIVYAMKFFLDWSPEHVVVLHDINGRTRSAYAISCFLAWEHDAEFTVPGAFSHFLERRVHPARRKELPISWYEMMKAFQTCVQQAKPFQPRKLQLMKLTASMAGEIESYERPPIIQVFQGGELIWDSEIDAVAQPELSSDLDTASGDLVFDEGALKCEIQRFVQGDVQLHMYADVIRKRAVHVFPTPSGHLPDMSAFADSASEEVRERRLVVRYAFHTNLMPSGGVISIEATARNVDLPSKLIRHDSFRLNLSLVDHALQSPTAAGTGELSFMDAGSERESDHPLALGNAGCGSLAETLPAVAAISTDPADIYLPSGCINWEFANLLNLRGHLAQLAGLYHLAFAHTIFPESYSIELLKREGLKETYFGLVCLQLAARNMDKARFLLHSDFLQRLQLPPQVSHPLANRPRMLSDDSDGSPVSRPYVLGGVTGGLGSSDSATSFTVGGADEGSTSGHPHARVVATGTEAPFRGNEAPLASAVSSRITDTMIPVIATALANLANPSRTPGRHMRTESDAASATSSQGSHVSSTGGSVEVGGGVSQITLHEEAQSFLTRSLHAMEEAADAETSRSASNSGGAGTTTAGSGVDVGVGVGGVGLHSSGVGDTSLASTKLMLSSIKSEMKEHSDPFLYAAALQVAMALLHAGKLEDAAISAGLAGGDGSVGEGRRSAKKMQADALESFSKLDVHSMTRLINETRLVLQVSARNESEVARTEAGGVVGPTRTQRLSWLSTNLKGSPVGKVLDRLSSRRGSGSSTVLPTDLDIPAGGGHTHSHSGSHQTTDALHTPRDGASHAGRSADEDDEQSQRVSKAVHTLSRLLDNDSHLQGVLQALTSQLQSTITIAALDAPSHTHAGTPLATRTTPPADALMAALLGLMSTPGRHSNLAATASGGGGGGGGGGVSESELAALPTGTHELIKLLQQASPGTIAPPPRALNHLFAEASGEGSAVASSSGQTIAAVGTTLTQAASTQPAPTTTTTTTTDVNATAPSAVIAEPTAVPPAANAATEAVATPNLAKYEAMLRLGIPFEAVRHKMTADGVDPTLLQAQVASTAAVAAAATDSTAAEPDVSKYEKMLKMGIPVEAVLHKARTDGIPADALDKLLAATGHAKHLAPADSTSAVDVEWKRRKAAEAAAEEESKRFEAEVAARRASRIAELLQEQVELVEEARCPLNVSKTYGGYFKMLKMGIPASVVEQKLILAKLDPAVLHMDPEQPRPDVQLVPLREDVTYGKYFRMLKFGLTRDMIEHKMKGDGVNELALDLNVELPAPPGLADLSHGIFVSSRSHQSSSSAAFAKQKRNRKKLHWEALPAHRIGSKPTIWSSSGDVGEGMDDSLVDDEEFEKLFTQEASASKAKAMPHVDASDAKKTVYLLESKRGRNVGIGLKKLKLSPEVVRHCMLSLSTVMPDGKRLSYEDLVLLEELLPTPEEIATVKAFKGDRSRLGEAEQFYLGVLDVTKAKARASALAFQCQFDAKVADLRDKLSSVNRASTQIRASPRLKRLLEAILKVGNRLNAADDEDAPPPSPSMSLSATASTTASTPHKRPTSSRNHVTAFTLNSLMKLTQTKSFNNKVTLLHYLVSRLRQVDADVLQVGEDLPDVAPAARMTSELLRADLAAIKQGLGVVEKLVREQARPDGSIGRARGGSASLSSTTGRPHAGSASGASLLLLSPTNTHLHGQASSLGSPPSSARREPKVGRMDSVSEAATDLAEAVDAILSGGSYEVGETLPGFVARAQSTVVQLQADLDSTLATYTELLEFFGEESTMSIESFFSTVCTFIKALDKAKQENDEDTARAEREARRSIRKMPPVNADGSGLTIGTSTPRASASGGPLGLPPLGSDSHARSASTPTTAALKTEGASVGGGDASGTPSAASTGMTTPSHQRAATSPGPARQRMDFGSSSAAVGASSTPMPLAGSGAVGAGADAGIGGLLGAIRARRQVN